MTSRLSSELLSRTYQSGHQAFSVPGLSEWQVPVVDIKKLVNSGADLRGVISRMTPQALWLAIEEVGGPGEALEILPLITNEQFRRLADYDVWRDDRLVSQAVFSWLQAFRAASPTLSYERFRGLDEEYQIATLAPYLRVVEPEQFEDLSESEQDKLRSLPGGALYYEVTSDEIAIQQGVEDLVSAAMAEDMAYTMNLLIYAAFSPPGEAEHQCLQFRRARLEEDGFLDSVEAASFFVPRALDRDALAVRTTMHPKVRQENSDFFRRCQEELESQDDFDSLMWRQTVFYLMNGIISATNIGPQDRQSLKIVSRHTIGLLNLSLDQLAAGDVVVGARILKDVPIKRLFQNSVQLVDRRRRLAIAILSDVWGIAPSDVAALTKWLRDQKFAKILEWFDRNVQCLTFEWVQFLKGLFNRFPLVMAEKAGDSSRCQFRPVVSSVDLSTIDDLLEGMKNDGILRTRC